MVWEEPVRLYTTVLLDSSGEPVVVIEVAPPASLGGIGPVRFRGRAVKDHILNPVGHRLDHHGEIGARDVPRAIEAMLRERDRLQREPSAETQPDSVRQRLLLFMEEAGSYVPSQWDDSLSRELAIYVSTAPLVPFERSPLTGDNLVTLSRDGLAVLATIGSNPVVWVEAAGGVVLVTAVVKWGRAIIDVGDQAIRYHLPRILRLPPDPLPTRRRRRPRA